MRHVNATKLSSRQQQAIQMALDKFLCEVNDYYRVNGRDSRHLKPAEVRLVKTGTFDALLKQRVSDNEAGNPSQAKTPRVIRNPSDIHTLQSAVLSHLH